VIREELISQGTLTSSPVHPREVFAPAVRHSAAAVVLVHNHPSGDPQPSADDLDITRRLADAGRLLGVRVVDHVIVGDGSFVSLADRGAVPP
jgi:DNA repair protein RadC